MHLGAQPVRHRLFDRRAQQRVAERRAPAALPLEQPHRHQLPGRDVRVHPQVGVEPLVRAAAGAFQLGDDAVDLLLREVGAQQRGQPRVRRQLGRQPTDLAFGQPVGDRQVGQLRQLVGGQEPDAVVGIAAHDAVSLQPAHELAEQERTAVRPGDQRLQRHGGDVLHRQQQPARQLGRRVGAQRPELQAKVRAAALAPARLHLRQRRPRRDRNPQRHGRLGHGRVFDRLQRRVVGEMRVVEDHHHRAFARQPPQRLAHAAADGRAQHAGRRSQRAQLRLVGRHPSQRQRRRRPQRRTQIAQQRLTAVGRLVGGQREAAAKQRAQVAVAFALDRLARAQLDDRCVADAGPHLLDQRRAQMRLAKPAVRQHRRQARGLLADAAARRRDQAIHLLAAADQRRLRRPHDGQRVVFARWRQGRDQRAVGGGGAAALGHQICRRGGQEQPAGGLRLDLLEQARERGADIAVATVGLLPGGDRRQIDDHAAARFARDQ